MSCDSRLVERLEAVLRVGPPLRVAVLLGSAARGEMRPDSDVDVAILPCHPDLALRDELDLQVSLSRAAGRDVDLLRLDRASTVVKWQVVRHGVRLAVGDAADHARFVAEAASEYLDFAPSLRRAQERFLRQLTAGAGTPR